MVLKVCVGSSVTKIIRLQFDFLNVFLPQFVKNIKEDQGKISDNPKKEAQTVAQ